ncbi:8-amino-7-oxononanoate synthase [Oikeobacillus pervagus]|uniref:8-amino-7-ketopelargonate synthase n=1 Tax=Oikeobacillus pervagus TaxID=1325931 RepID=A0AAJ1T3B5_9BACI|nr:8-amino-7-oxononanoate synthase [Oikeobacillus pervagus]MDQ0216007.1 8-amino-7-oxononanoate synthase [Oikeobacillus pervagus]
MDEVYETFFANELKRIEKNQQTRVLRTFHGPNKAYANIEGKESLLFSSNHYLGLGTDKDVQKGAIDAIEQYGAGSGGSRLTTGNSLLHQQLEEAIAKFKGTENALLFSSGFLANVGVISSIMGKGDIIFSDEYNHASIIDGCRLSKARTVIYKHCDLQSLETALQTEKTDGKKLIVTDGVFSMDGDVAPLREIQLIARKYGALLMVDDAHGTGVIGNHGKGSANYFGVENIDITVGTLSKAIGAEGGFVAGSNLLIHYLKNRARTFIFQTSLSPGVVGAALAAIQKIESTPQIVEKLQWNSAYMRRRLREEGFHVLEGVTAIIPLIIGKAEEALQFSKLLEEEGVFAPAIRPPTVPEGTSRIRITVMATHTKEQIEQVVQIFVQAAKKMKLYRTIPR